MKTIGHRRVEQVRNGFSLVELLIVAAICGLIAALALPALLNIMSMIRLRAAAGELSGLMQEARILAAKRNAVFDVKYTTLNGIQIAYLDTNVNGAYDAGEPVTTFNGKVTPASGPPTGSGGQPTPFVLTGDSSSGTPFGNQNVLAFNQRGLPCNYDTSTSPPTCATPAASYFVYYLQGTNNSNWAAVVVTKAGRTQTWVWNGTQWSK